MYSVSRLLTVLSAATLGYAHPTITARDVPAAQLNEFALWVQYAAAAYCQDNYSPPAGTKLTCWAGNCPDVEAADAVTDIEFSNTTLSDTAGFVTADHEHSSIVVSFRGSYSVRNWLADANFPFVDPGLCTGCLAEAGFWSSWIFVKKEIVASLKRLTEQHADYRVVVVGHSLGAAVATVAAADLRTLGYQQAALYAYASPRVGNDKLAEFITKQENNYRFTHQNDPVPKLPLVGMGYQHVSPEYWITSGDNTTVTASDIEVLEGNVNWKGNTGTGLPLLTDFHAHHWYFEKADGCKGPGLPFK
ncbi:lipase family protein [Aspergillus affinis]|uniref:lipase family protein n=1 Tax=Aspergillus affinis TaxID=1070780 RepID=UPI0022FEAF50|nr:alpha/beta-hydrolase [Aspergillus affinis]KAI9036528.1 alpha/beta-hydrolase [Aspergillus affinis]